MIETSDHQENAEPAGPERACAYRVLRYTPNLVRDEWVNIGVLLFDPQTGERRLRMIEEEDEFRCVRRLHPGAGELLLRAIRDDLEDRFQSASANGGKGQAGNWQHSWASGMRRFQMLCNSLPRRASLPRTWMPNWSGCMATTSLRSALPAAWARPEPRGGALVLLAGLPAGAPVGAA